MSRSCGKKGDNNMNNQLTKLKVTKEEKGNNTIVTVQKGIIMDRTNDVWSVNGKYVHASSYGMNILKMKKHKIRRTFTKRIHGKGELSIGSLQVPLGKGDKVKVTKDEVFVFTKGKETQKYRIS